MIIVISLNSRNSRNSDDEDYILKIGYSMLYCILISAIAATHM